MDPGIPRNPETFEALFNAIPAPIFVVDPDVRIMACNIAATALIGEGADYERKRGGDVLKCINAMQTPEGCGHAPACKHCVIRNSVAQAVRGGQVYRTKVRMDVLRGSHTAEIHVLVTASPFALDDRRLVLLVLEDINELIQLQRLLPICAWCKKVRNSENYWESVETYFRTRIDVQFTHGMCEECYASHFPELKKPG